MSLQFLFRVDFIFFAIFFFFPFLLVFIANFGIVANEITPENEMKKRQMKMRESENAMVSDLSVAFSCVGAPKRMCNLRNQMMCYISISLESSIFAPAAAAARR